LTTETIGRAGDEDDLLVDWSHAGCPLLAASVAV